MLTQARRPRRNGTSQRIGAITGAVLASCLFLSACTGGSDTPTPTSSEDTGVSGGDVIGEFAEAWANPTISNFRGVVDEPGVAAHDISAHVAELGITETTVEPTGDLDCGSDSCDEHALVTHQLAGADEWSYETLIKASLNQGQWLVNWSASTFHPDLTDVTTLVRHRTLPTRAPILDRNGVALTPEREIVRVGVVAKKVQTATYGDLGALLDIDVAALRDRVTSSKPNWFVSVIDLRRKDYEPLREDLLQVPGISIDTAKRALAPTAAWGRTVLGTVAPATADGLKNAGPYALPTDEVGTTGLQFAYQERLAGTPGISIDLVEKSPEGGVLDQVLSRHAKPGQPLETTLDLHAQNAAERAVVDATNTTSVVLIKASTGEVLAAANAPGPTTYNTAFVGRYAPGSTFKTVSAAALLGNAIVSPATHVTCPDTTVVDGKRFKNYEQGITGPNPTFAQAYAASCNTTMVSFADRLTGKQLAESAKEFGFGADWELGLDSFSGSVPADDDKVTRAADMIGQGKVVASPLMMAMAAAAVDSGVSRTPTLLPGEASGRRLTELDPTTVSQLQKMMRLVVTDGTGTAVDLPGLPVYAKTGTAEFQQGNGTGTNAWMIGYRGDIAFVVLVEKGSSGAHDAAPIVDSLLSQLPASLYR
ncbi:MAG: penicillin-binding transpeptidase domain-containing protein [Nocardioidaceae bacterium]